MDNVKIEIARIAHIDAIEKIETTLKHRNLSYQSLKNDLTNTNCYYIIATINDIIVGYAGMEMLVDHADITAIAVSKEYQKKGIATQLLNNLSKKCQQLHIDKIFLEVRTSNIPAINLYEKLGFKKISTRKNYYDNIEDADIYVKDLV